MTGCGKTPFCGKKILMITIVCACLVLPAGSAPAATPAENDSRDLAALLAEQNNFLSRELRRIQREIAALRADLDKPRLQDVMGGIGYIFGLFGTAAFVAARRRGRNLELPTEGRRNHDQD